MNACNPCDSTDERRVAGVKPIALADPAVLSDLRCEEASILSRETYIPCGAPAAAIVWHAHDGKHIYLMCLACAWHNVRNRSARLLLTTDPALMR